MSKKRKPGVKLKRVHIARGEAPTRATNVRFSTAVANLRREGLHDGAAELIRDQELYGSSCPTHGAMSDPVIMIASTPAGERVAFICPQCSGGEILEAWKREGARS